MQPDKNSQIDEAVWQGWVEKNKAQDRFRYERRLKVMALVAVFVTLIALLPRRPPKTGHVWPPQNRPYEGRLKTDQKRRLGH